MYNESDFNTIGGVGPVTLNGFTPFTTYNCRVIALNAGGSGLAASLTVTTEDDCKLVIRSAVCASSY